MSYSVPDPSWHTLYRVGAISGLVFAVPALTAIAVVTVWPPPTDATGAATLEYIAEHRWLYATEQILWLLPCLLAILVFLALCAAVWRVDKGYALAVGVVGVFSWALALAMPITGGGSPVLVALSNRYSTATTDAQRTAYATAAEALIAENNTVSFVGVLEPLAILLISLLMVRASLPRWIGYLGVVTGSLGVVSEALRPVIGATYAIYGSLMLVWFVAVGAALYRVSQARPEQTDGSSQAPMTPA
ncbi:MAG TPA: DUF4386 family protein [Jiangellales bacterium]|nr:DUF4386 family protein [Jiangellales bacterium]